MTYIRYLGKFRTVRGNFPLYNPDINTAVNKARQQTCPNTPAHTVNSDKSLRDTMATSDISSALEALNTPQPLSILTLSEPVLSSKPENQRSSNISSSNNAGDTISPAALQADLAHYKDLFSKLRFSYVEQVTKERFLKSIVADPPEAIDVAENDALSQKLVADKAALKAKKEEVRNMILEIEELGRSVVRRYELVKLQTAQLEALPEEIRGLDETIEELRAKVQQGQESEDPEMNLGLVETVDLVAEREAELQELDRRAAELQDILPRKKREVAGLEDELKPLEKRKRNAIEEAQEAQKKRGKGGMGDEIERRGRWLKGVEVGLKAMLEL